MTLILITITVAAEVGRATHGSDVEWPFLVRHAETLAAAKSKNSGMVRYELRAERVTLIPRPSEGNICRKALIKSCKTEV